MEKDMSADVAHGNRQGYEHVAEPERGGHGIGSRGDPRRSSGQLADVVVTEQLKTRGARPRDLESENEFLHSLAQHLLTDPDRILERSIRAAARLCGAGSAGVSLLEPEQGNEVFRWAALGGAFEGQEGRATPRFFSPCGLAFDRQAPQLFSHPARYYTCLHGAAPEIVEALIVPLPDGTGTIWVVTHDEETRFDGEHVRLLTGLATFMSGALQLLRLTHQAKGASDRTERALTIRPESPGAARSGIGVPHAFSADAPPVTQRTERTEVLLAFRALVEQGRLVVRDGGRFIRRVITLRRTSGPGGRAHARCGPAPLASVPLVVLRSTTEREQLELNDLAESLRAEGYQVDQRGPQWVVYTEIADRRKSSDHRRGCVEERRH
jgi:hypothetical protein